MINLYIECFLPINRKVKTWSVSGSNLFKISSKSRKTISAHNKHWGGNIVRIIWISGENTGKIVLWFAKLSKCSAHVIFDSQIQHNRWFTPEIPGAAGHPRVQVVILKICRFKICTFIIDFDSFRLLIDYWVFENSIHRLIN